MNTNSGQAYKKLLLTKLQLNLQLNLQPNLRVNSSSTTHGAQPPDGCGTGWNLNAEHMRFGRSGIVGSWWKELYVEIKFSQPVAIGGIKTDSSEELPYKVECLTKAGVWEVVKENCRGTTRLDSTVMTRAVKLSWMDTDMRGHSSQGNPPRSRKRDRLASPTPQAPCRGGQSRLQPASLQPGYIQWG